MTGRSLIARPDPGLALPAFERFAPPPPPELVASRIDAHTGPGDIVVDLHGRGGWVARAAVDRQRRAISIESTPLTRLLAEIVMRPPDIRHLDAAFQALAAAPRRESSLRVSITEPFATRCRSCGRSLIADEVVWGVPGDQADAGGPPAGAEADEPADAALVETVVARPLRIGYRCVVCRDQQGGPEQRTVEPDAADLRRARSDPDPDARRVIRDRFPAIEGAEALVDELLDLHTGRQIAGLAAILERIETDLRAANVEAALRLSLVHALLPASRLNRYPSRALALRIANGHVRIPVGGQWRERNPWSAFEDGFRTVRGFVARLEGMAGGPVAARLGEDARSLVEGGATVSLRIGTPTVLRGLAHEAADAARSGARERVRLVVCQPPLRPSPDRLAFTYLATGWALGREAASLLPLDALSATPPRVPWGWQVAALRRSLEAVGPLLAHDGRAAILTESGGMEALVAAVLAGAGAGYRLLSARLAEPGEDAGGVVELVAPGAPLGSARSRANVSLPHETGGRGDPDIVPGRGIFAPPERFDARPFSEADARRTVVETAVAVLRARGEPARLERLIGEVLVGLDRDGHLRRLVLSPAVPGTRRPERTGGPAGGAVTGSPAAGSADASLAAGSGHAAPAHAARGPEPAATARAATEASAARAAEVAGLDAVERLTGLIRDELSRPDARRLAEIEPDRFWLATPADIEAAAVPLADRVEWAVFSLLSNAGPLSEPEFFDRIAGLFAGPDLPDETLVRACLESYRSRASTGERIVTSEDLVRRSNEHSELIAILASVGHRLGLGVHIGARQQDRRAGRYLLGELIDERERRVHLPLLARAARDALEEVDCIWYVRNRLTMLWEVDWTAMLSEPILRRGARIQTDERVVRFVVVVPERVELIRHKLERSPILRETMEADNWRFLRADQLRRLAALDAITLADLEPYLGLDPDSDRRGEQLALFGG
jgi:hypothetical protein